MWFIPSAKRIIHVLYLYFSFLVHTMDELKLTGNSLKGSRPILSFDKVSQTNMSYP